MDASELERTIRLLPGVFGVLSPDLDTEVFRLKVEELLPELLIPIRPIDLFPDHEVGGGAFLPFSLSLFKWISPNSFTSSTSSSSVSSVLE